MSDLVFVLDVEGRPLMPMAPAHARRLIQRGHAQRVYHHAFPIVQLTTPRERRETHPTSVGIALHRRTAEMQITMTTPRTTRSFAVLIDLQPDGFRRLRQQGVPCKARQSHNTLRNRLYSTPLIHWRTRAIVRVMQAFQHVLPITTWHWLDTPPSHTRTDNILTQLLSPLLPFTIESGQAQAFHASDYQPKWTWIAKPLRHPSTIVQNNQTLRRGMLCEVHTTHTKVTGIVHTIHHSGQLTVIYPHTATRVGIQWDRLIISSRQYLRIRATTPVIFFAYQGDVHGSS